MRVAYLCHRIPYPPDKGDKIRAFHQVQAIAARHELDLFTLADDPADLVHRPALAPYCRQITVAQLNSRMARIRALPFLLTGTALTVPYFYSAELAAAVRKAVLERSYDRIFVYCSAMTQYVEFVDQIPIVTDLVDVDSGKWTQYARYARFPMSAVYRREGYCLRRYEKKVCEKSSSIVVATEREAELARAICDFGNVHVITNGVNTDYFNPDRVSPAPMEPTVIFTGDMSYFPNQEAVTYFSHKVLPLVQRSIAGARLLIVGRNPNGTVRQLEKLPGVEVTGFVPDIRVYLAKARVAVAPFSIAAGIQNKILEAMAYGLPVVSTSRTLQGLSRDVAALVDTGDSAEEMADKVVALLRDPDYARQKGIDGRNRVAARYNWARSLDALLRLLESSASPRPS